MSDIEIAQQAKMQPIIGLAAEKFGIPAEHLDPYGHYKAKISLDYVNSLADKEDGETKTSCLSLLMQRRDLTT